MPRGSRRSATIITGSPAGASWSDRLTKCWRRVGRFSRSACAGRTSSWSGIWHGDPKRVLIEQTYPGASDHRAHFDTLLPAFADPRYLRVEGKPLLLIYKPEKLPDARATLDLWRGMAIRAGLGGLHIAGMTARPEWEPTSAGFDAKVLAPLVNERPWISRRRPVAWLRQRWAIRRGWPASFPYDDRMTEMLRVLRGNLDAAAGRSDVYPCLLHAWDNTPRSGPRGVVLTGSAPERFRACLEAAIELLRDVPDQRRIVVLKSWNEWAEGNHLEPDLAYGLRYLDVVRGALARTPSIPGSVPFDSQRRA